MTSLAIRDVIIITLLIFYKFVTHRIPSASYVLQTTWDDLLQNSINKAILWALLRLQACVKAGGGHFEHISNKLFLQGFELLASCDSLKCQIYMFSFDFNTSTLRKTVIFIVIVLHGSVVV